MKEIIIHSTVPASGEITLISKLTDEYIDVRNQINGLFADYAQFNLVSGITSAKISELREKATKLDNYEKSLRPILDRAEAVITGQIKKDPHREFSTKPGSKNQLEQKGNSVSYCRNTLKFQKYGCNSQVIGIGGTGDKPITVFVDVEPLVTFNSPVSQKSSYTMSIKSAHTMSHNYLENMTLPDGEELFGDFGVDEETSEKIYFICWDHNGVRYKKKK